MGLTRGETQGTSLALFYRFFAGCVISYAVGFQFVDMRNNGRLDWIFGKNETTIGSVDGLPTADDDEATMQYNATALASALWKSIPYWLTQIGQFMYIAFFLVMHLMKLHSISLVWGVTTEAMEYEDVARKQQDMRRNNSLNNNNSNDDADISSSKKKTRLQRLALVGFGGTLGGVWGR
jgi:hypothetical protein